MTDPAVLAPALGMGVEYPVAGPMPPGFCENYALNANDPVSGIHLLACWGTQLLDASLWHEMVQIRIPGDRTLAVKSVGRASARQGPGAAITQWRCQTPGHRWHLTIDGFGRLVDTRDLCIGPVADGPWTRVVVSLTFEGAGAPWVLSTASFEHGPDTAGFHYEHSGYVKGTVTVGDETFPFDGTGLRDHSLGPRDFSTVHDHAWIDCVFPSGRYFSLYRMRLAGGGGGVSAGALNDGQTFAHATSVEVPLLEEDAVDKFTIVIEADGRRHVIDAEVVSSLGTTTYLTPNHMVIGLSHAAEATQIVKDGLARFIWDGEVGFGHAQRSVSACAQPLDPVVE